MTRQEELEAMSELEINDIIHELRFSDDGAYVNILGNYSSRDYCNNPGYIMPIARDNFISVELFKNCVIAKSILGGFECTILYLGKPENEYCRAICIVFILMSESKS